MAQSGILLSRSLVLRHLSESVAGVRRGVVELLILLLFLSCGKKEPPPSPDRWPPKLVSVKALDNLHVSCYFSEELDGASAERRENYTIAGPEEGLDIHTAFLDPSGIEVNLVTSPQKEIEYSLSVEDVRDLAGNEIPEGSEQSFKGSLVPDTIPPITLSTYPKDRDVRVPTDTTLVISFSEPMDTATVYPILLPSGFGLSTTWSPSMTRVMIDLGTSGEDTLEENCVYNLFLSLKAKDLGGNRLRSGWRITFSTQNSIPEGSISGRVSPEEGDPRGAIVLLLKGDIWEQSFPFSLTQVEDSSGAYAFFCLPPSSYFVLGAQSKGGRRWAGGYEMGPPDFSPQLIELPPDTAFGEIDFILYPESEKALSALKRFQQISSHLLDE